MRYRQVLSAKLLKAKGTEVVLPRFYHRTDVNFTYVKSVACLATVLSEVQSPLNQSFRGAVAVSPELPASRDACPVFLDG